jgi:peptide methionine sulfoxide reductase MsrB
MGNVVSSFVLTSIAAASAETIVLATFDGAAGTTRMWKEQNDPVMGGKSSGTFTIGSGTAIFDGIVEDVPFLRAPGFIKASTTDSEPFPDISSCRNIELEVMSTEDFAGYRFSFGTAKAPGGKRFASGYKSTFAVPPLGNFGVVSIPIKNFTDFWDDATGDPIKTCLENSIYCPDQKTLANLQTMSIWAEGVKGKVHLEVKSIQASGCTAPALQAGSAGRLCPAIPNAAKACSAKNISDVQFEPVCITREINAEIQQRRCMKGQSSPYYQDSQGVFRCACCGAPLWKPSLQFDQLPADKWPWPSFHSPPINGTDGLPNVCHRGPGYGITNRNATVDLGLGVEGEVGCARCGVHLGDFFNTPDLGVDHYCINGVCMVPPDGKLGDVCTPTEDSSSMSVVV